MQRIKNSRLLRLGAAFLVNALALLLAALLETRTQEASFLLLMGAVIFSSWYGGRIPGLLAVAAATWAMDYRFLGPASVGEHLSENVVRLCTFVAASLLVSGVNSARTAQRRAEIQRENLERQQKWLQSILDVNPTPLVLLDASTEEVLFANRAAQQVGSLPVSGTGGTGGTGGAEGAIASLTRGTIRRLTIDALSAGGAARGGWVENVPLQCEVGGEPYSFLVSTRRLEAMYGHPEALVTSYQDVTGLMRTEEALRTSENRYRTLAEAAPVGIFNADATGRFLYVNDRWRQITGQSASAALGEGWQAALDPEYRDSLVAAWYAAMEEGRDFSRECCLAHTGGARLDAILQADALRDQAGSIRGYVGTLIDITERKQAEGRLRILAEASAMLAAEPLYESTIQAVLRLALPWLGTWFVADVARAGGIEEPGSHLREPALSGHLDAGAEGDLRRFLLERAGEDGAVLASEPAEAAAPRVVPAPTLFGSGAPEGIEASSCLCLPLVSHGRTEGMLVFGAPQGRASYTPDCVAFAEDLAGRIATVLENGRLFRQTQAIGRQLMHQLDFTNAITRSMGEALCAADLEGSIIFANPVAARLLGFAEEELYGQELADALPLIHADGREVSPDERPFTQVRKGEHVHTRELLARRRDGHHFPISLTYSPIVTEDRVTGLVLAFRDITQQKTEEEALRQLSEERASLVATVSHALRAPITAMLLNFEVLEDGTLGPLTGEQQQFIGSAIQSVLQLAETVEDLLTLTRLQARRVRLFIEPFDPALLLRTICDKMRVRAQSRELELQLELHPEVRPGMGEIESDQRQLESIVTELLENAIKYSRPGGCVRLQVEPAPGGLRIQVADNGPGLAPEEIPHLFEPFYRGAASQDEQVQGTGLGLQIVRKTASLLGGDVEAGNGPDGGALFTLHLPKRCPHPDELEESEAALPSASH